MLQMKKDAQLAYKFSNALKNFRSRSPVAANIDTMECQRKSWQCMGILGPELQQYKLEPICPFFKLSRLQLLTFLNASLRLSRQLITLSTSAPSPWLKTGQENHSLNHGKGQVQPSHATSCLLEIFAEMVLV